MKSSRRKTKKWLAIAKAGNRLVVTGGSAKKGRTKVLLFGEELGF